MLLFLIECVEDDDEARHTRAAKTQVNYLQARVIISVVLDVGVKMASVSAVSITHLNERKEMDDQEMHDLQISANSGNLPSEDELFASMAKVQQPLAPDLDPMQLDYESLAAIAKDDPSHADNIRAEVKARFPGLTESDLDELLM